MRGNRPGAPAVFVYLTHPSGGRVSHHPKRLGPAHCFSSQRKARAGAHLDVLPRARPVAHPRTIDVGQRSGHLRPGHLIKQISGVKSVDVRVSCPVKRGALPAETRLRAVTAPDFQLPLNCSPTSACACPKAPASSAMKCRNLRNNQSARGPFSQLANSG